MSTLDNPLDAAYDRTAALAEAEARRQFDAQTEVDDLKWLLSNKRGRRIAARILERAGVWRLSFSPNALTMAFNEGGRNVGLGLLAQITQHCPEKHIEILKERT